MSTTCRWQARDPRSKWSPWSIWKPKDQDSWRWYKFKDGANQSPHSNRPYKKFPPTQAFAPFRSSVGWTNLHAEEGSLCCTAQQFMNLSHPATLSQIQIEKDFYQISMRPMPRQNIHMTILASAALSTWQNSWNGKTWCCYCCFSGLLADQLDSRMFCLNTLPFPAPQYT